VTDQNGSTSHFEPIRSRRSTSNDKNAEDDDDDCDGDRNSDPPPRYLRSSKTVATEHQTNANRPGPRPRPRTGPAHDDDFTMFQKNRTGVKGIITTISLFIRCASWHDAILSSLQGLHRQASTKQGTIRKRLVSTCRH